MRENHGMRSERLVLRPPTLAGRGGVAHPHAREPGVPPALGAHGPDAGDLPRVRRARRGRRTGSTASRAASTDGALTGFFNIGEIVRGNFQNAFLGYGGVAEFAGQGYMTEGLRAGARARRSPR